MNILQLFTFKTYWGRYFIFSILTVAFSLSALVVDVSGFPNGKVSMLFLLIAPHFIYWMISVFISFERDFLQKKHENGSRKSLSLNLIVLMCTGAFLFIYNVYQVLASSDYGLLPFVPIGLAILLAGYQDYQRATDSE